MSFRPTEYRIGNRIVYTSSAPCAYLEWESPSARRECFDQTAKEMKKLGISHVVVLLEEQEIQEMYDGKLKSILESFGFTVIQYPIPDHYIPKNMKSFSDLQSGLVELTEGNRILVHCLGGFGRAGTVVAGFFITLGNDSEKAIQMVRMKNPRAIETTDQEEFLRQYARR